MGFTFRTPPSYKLCSRLVDSQDTGFEKRGAPPDPTFPSIEVDYGSYIRFPTGTPRLTKQALVLGSLEHDWQWDTDHPVHMICHSQGGNTVRLLIELLSGRHASLHPAYFSKSRQSLIKSVVTLGTPYLGTTITSVVFDVSTLVRLLLDEGH